MIIHPMATASQPQIVLFYPKRHDDYGFYADLKDNPYVKMVNPAQYLLDSRFLRLVRQLLPVRMAMRHSTLARRIAFKVAGKRFHKEYQSLPQECKHAKLLIVMDLSLNGISSMRVFERCRKENPDLRIILYLINTIGNKDAQNRKDLKKLSSRISEFEWDDVYSFDREDCRKFGYKYMGFNYYSRKKLQRVAHPQHHVFFVACYSQERVGMVNKAYRTLTQAGCRCDFHIKLWDEGYDTMTDGIHYLTKGQALYPYSQCLEMMQDSKCILEIVRPGQHGPTLRYMEAVCYNKKLLTNNPAIVDFPYYHPEYMRVFDRIEDIDVDWVTSDEEIDYGYHGDFSPNEMILSLMKQKG